MIILNVFNQADYDIRIIGNKYQEGNTYPLRAVKDWATVANADLVFNFAFFNFDTMQNRRIGAAGRTLQYCHNPNIGDIGYNAQSPAPTPMMSLLNGCRWCGWKLAVLNGIVQTSKLDRNTKRARNMNGLTTDGRYIQVTSDRQTEIYVASEVARRVKTIWHTEIKYLAVNDAGGSTQEYSSMSKLGYYPEGLRNVATVVALKRKKIYNFTRQLQYGCKGEDVKILQMALGGIEVDGSFGRGTRSRLIQAQKALKVNADGYFGPITAKAMGFTFE